jgi:hypothetical protein
MLLPRVERAACRDSRVDLEIVAHHGDCVSKFRGRKKEENVRLLTDGKQQT